MTKSRTLALQSIFVGLLATWLFIVIAEVGVSNLGIPLTYSGDGLAYSHHVKRIIEDGWIVANARLGAPFGSAFYGYPIPDTLSLLVMRLIAIASDQYAVVLNVYIIACFGMNAASAHLSSRLLGLGAWVSGLVGILFAFTPFFFLRVPHLFFLFAPAIPLVVMLSIRLALRNLPLSRRGLAWGGVVCVVAGASGAYYAAFAVMLLFLAALLAWLSAGGRERLALVVAPVAVACTFAACLGTSVSLQRSDEVTTTQSHVERDYTGVEVYGLKLIQMVLPSPMHRSSRLASFSQEYGSVAPLVNENATAALGIVGSVGLGLGLLFLALGEGISRRQRVISTIMVGIFAIGTIGGLGAVFAFFVTPELRALNRTSIVLQFLSLLTVAFALEAGAKKLSSRPMAILVPATLVLGLVGLWDQTPKGYFRRAQVEREFLADRAFFQEVERGVGLGGMVFIYPYASFPEQPPLANEGPYGMMKGFLQTKSVKWSYGGMKYDLRMEALADASRTFPESIGKLQSMGFTGVVVNMAALGVDGPRLRDSVVARLGNASVVEKGGARYFWAFPREVVREPAVTVLEGGDDTGMTPEGVGFTWLSSDARLGITFPDNPGIHQPLAGLSCAAVVRSIVPVAVSVSQGDRQVASATVPGTPVRLEFKVDLAGAQPQLTIHVERSTETPIPRQGSKELALMLFTPTCAPYR